MDPFEDDYEWLKDAFQVQAGTSSESLNESAVQFSPRFSVQELRDPSDSLVYNEIASVEPFPQNLECVDSVSILSPKLHVLEYEGQNSGHKRKVNDDEPESYNAMLKRVRSSVVENDDNTQSTDYIYGQEKKHNFASPVSTRESLRQHFPNFETVFDAAAFKTLTESWDFEEDETSLTCADIDIGDSIMLCQIPTQNICSIPEPTFLERQVEEKESVANSVDFISAGDANNSKFMGFDVHSDAMDQIPCQNMEHFVPRTDGNLAAGSSASIMDLSKLKEFLLTDIDGIDTANIPNLDSFLLDILDENIGNIQHSSIPGGGACSGDDINYGQFMNCSLESAMLTSIPAENLELPSAPAANNLEHHVARPPEANLSAPAANCVDPELYNRVICCVLNTEDTEIPCNDGADFTLFSAIEIPGNNDASTMLPSSTKFPCNDEAHLSALAANCVDPELYNGVICCVLNTEDSEIPCNDGADFTLFSAIEIPGNNDASTMLPSPTKFPCSDDDSTMLSSGTEIHDDASITQSSRRRRSDSSRKTYQHRGLKALYFAETFEETPHSSEMVQSKKALFKGKNIKETLDPSETIQSKKALYRADNIKETPNSSETIQSDILSELGLNLPFIKRGGQELTSRS